MLLAPTRDPAVGATSSRGSGGRTGVPVSAPRVVLVSPKHAGNVGASARAMKNFGLADLWLVAPRCRIDREARALAAHAGDVLDAAVTVATLDEALADRSDVVGTTARVRAADAHRSVTPEAALARMRDRPAALVFGPEDTGLDNDALDRCTAVVTLPTAPYASLNLAQAVVVFGYLWHRGDAAAPPSAGPPPAAAPRAQVEGMLDQLGGVLLRTGYTDRRRLATALRHLRALLDRAAPSAEEVARLRGVWSQIAWGLEQDPAGLPEPEAAGARLPRGVARHAGTSDAATAATAAEAGDAMGEAGDDSVHSP